MHHASTVAPALLSMESVRVAFEQAVAVRDVSMELQGGMLLGLVGPNGAGKTTLLRAIAGLQSLTRGQIHVLGERVVGGMAGGVLSQIGFTPDTPPVYEDLTVHQFLQFIALGYGFDQGDVDERIDFWLEKVWLTEKRDQKIKSLSRGMRQRIGIARTLLPNPALILLDEPAAGLDPAGRVQFRELLISLRTQGKGLIVSSHILADMHEYCTHMAIMSAGRIVQMGTVAEVTAHSNGKRCRYSLVLARPVVRVEDVLGRLDDVSDVQVNRERITLEYSSHVEDAADLLAKMMGEGLPVASFAPQAPGLEQAYLRFGIRQVD